MKEQSIAISACLLGHKVRYDGGHEANEIIKQLAESFNIVAVCPEVEIGLGVPRTKIELHQRGDEIHLLSCSEPIIDLTEQMTTFAHDFLQNHAISGMILKDKSPSCGVANCKVFDETGSMLRDGSGIFSATMMQVKPDLPMLQSNLVVLPGDLDCFIQKVKDYGY